MNEKFSPQFNLVAEGLNIKGLRDEVHIFNYWCTQGISKDKSWRRLSDGKRIVPLSASEFEYQKEKQLDECMDWNGWRLENWKTEYEIYDAKAIIDGLRVKLLFKSINYYPEVSYEKLFSQNNINEHLSEKLPNYYTSYETQQNIMGQAFGSGAALTTGATLALTSAAILALIICVILAQEPNALLATIKRIGASVAALYWSMV